MILSTTLRILRFISTLGCREELHVELAFSRPEGDIVRLLLVGRKGGAVEREGGRQR